MAERDGKDEEHNSNSLNPLPIGAPIRTFSKLGIWFLALLSQSPSYRGTYSNFSDDIDESLDMNWSQSPSYRGTYSNW